MSNITATPQKPQNVDVNKMTFSGVKSLPSGAKIIYLNYEGNSLFVQTPEMTVPYDSGTFYADNDNPGSGKYNIKVSMDGFNEDGQMKKFHDMLVNMDKKIMESGMNQGQVRPFAPELCRNVATASRNPLEPLRIPAPNY